MLLGVVVGRVAEGGVDPAFGRAGVAANRVDLRDDGDVGAHVERLDRGAHTRAAAPDDQHVVRRVHDFGRYTNRCALGSATAQASSPSTAICSLTHSGSQSELPESGDGGEVALDLLHQLLGSVP